MSSAFSGKAGRLASMAALTASTANQQNIDARIQAGQTSALDALTGGLDQSKASLTSGYAGAQDQYGEARSLYDPYVASGQKAMGVYNDAIGLNGAAGNTSATSAFTAAPGYQYTVDQATDAEARKASALGSLGSGNTQVAIANTAGHLADQGYNSWLDRLSGVNQMGYAATGAQAGLTKGMGDLDVSQGKDMASLYSDDASRRAGVFGNSTQLGVSSQTNTGNQNVNAVTQGMLAGQNASANTWGALLGGAKTAAGLFGSLAGGGASSGLLSALKSLGGSSYQDATSWT